MRKLFFLSLVFAVVANSAQAQNGVFDDVILDGGASNNPHVRFDQPNGDRHFMVGFAEQLAAYVVNGYKFRVYETADSSALTLDSAGVNVNRELNISTTTDNRQIDISHSTGQVFSVRSLNSSNGLFDGGIGLGTNSNPFPFYVFDGADSETLALNTNGVGIGTFNPTDPLHVYSEGSSDFPEAKVVVENNIGGTAVPRSMFELINNGGSRFVLTDTSINSSWFFGTTSSGALNISKAGTGGSEFRFFPNGRVVMGLGGAVKFDLNPNGNLQIAGTLTQSSDRNLKTQFADVDQNEVLDRVGDMPIQSWQFKFDDPKLRHVGPTAQDFRAAFELGQDDKTIAPVDGIGVSLAAIKALKQKSDDKEKRVVALEAELEAQQQQIADQKRLLLTMEKRLVEMETIQAAK